MGDTGVYVWGAYAMGVVLALTEVGLLWLRDGTIRRYFGWRRGQPPPDTLPPVAGGSPEPE